MSPTNLFALASSEPPLLDSVATDLGASGEFVRVWRPASGWVAAAAPLPGDEAMAEAEGELAFVERPAEDGWHGRLPPPRDLDRWLDESPELLASLPGDFGFVRFRPNASAVVARSCGGLVPFYLFESRACAAVSTRLGDLARFLPGEPEIDPLVNAIWSSGGFVFPDGRTFLAGVSILGRGQWTRIDRGRRRGGGRYWDPRQKRLGKPEPREHAERLQRLLVERLDRDLDPSGGNLLSWSGGVDSSSLAALAAGVVGRPLCTVSAVPPPDHPRFEHELSYLRPLARRYGLDPCLLIHVDADTRMRLFDAAPRVVFHVSHPVLSALPAIRRQTPVRLLLGGEFADEVCGSILTVPDWAAHTSLLRLLTGRVRLPFGPQDLGRWVKHRWLAALRRPFMGLPETLEGHVHPRLRQEYEQWRRRRCRQAGRERCANRFFHLRCELMDTVLAMNWEVTSSLGIRRSLPFFNREILELAGECHPAELIGDGAKGLLRAALRDHVPRRNLQRTDKGRWGLWGSNVRDDSFRWLKPLPEILAPVLAEGWFPRPPELVSLPEARCLRQLEVFAESLVLRRRGGTVEAAHLPFHRLDGVAADGGTG